MGKYTQKSRRIKKRRNKKNLHGEHEISYSKRGRPSPKEEARASLKNEDTPKKDGVFRLKKYCN